MLTLGQAARMTATSKTTLTRAIKAGKLSATRNEDGSYSIEPSELARVYEIQPATLETGPATGNAVHQATPGAGQGVTPATPDVEMLTHYAALEAELKGLRDMVTELRQSRDAWQQQAERATTALAAPSRSEPVRLAWWPWRRAG